MIDEEKYVFFAEWFDKTSYVTHKFFLTYYPHDGTVDLYDRKNKKMFLKRTSCNTVNKRDFYLQNTVNIFSRKIQLIDYADRNTAEILSSKSERTVVVLTSQAIFTVGLMIDMAQTHNFATTKLQIIQMSKSCLEILKRFMKTEYSPIADFLNKNITIVEFIGEKVVEKINKILQDIKMREFVRDNNVDGILYQSCSITHLSKPEEVMLFSMTYIPKSFQHSVCCIIKPHAIREGSTGKILMDIANAKFNITAMTVIEMDYDQAKQFYLVYKGVVTEYPGMVSQLSSGSCIVLCIENPMSDTVENSQTFRDFVGPADPEIARKIRPGTLRAKYGSNKIMNAVHCTDLPEDGDLELSNCFFAIC